MAKRGSYKKLIYQALEKLLVKLVLHFLKVSGSFQTYLVTQLVEFGYDRFVIPLSNYLIRRGLLFYDTTRGKIAIKDLRQAREDNNADDYDRAVDDILH